MSENVLETGINRAGISRRGPVSVTQNQTGKTSGIDLCDGAVLTVFAAFVITASGKLANLYYITHELGCQISKKIVSVLFFVFLSFGGYNLSRKHLVRVRIYWPSSSGKLA
jgi:hypothetical protein